MSKIIPRKRNWKPVRKPYSWPKLKNDVLSVYVANDKKNGLLWITKAQLFESTLSLIKDPAKLQSLSKAAVANSKRFDQNIFFK